MKYTKLIVLTASLFPFLAIVDANSQPKGSSQNTKKLLSDIESSVSLIKSRLSKNTAQLDEAMRDFKFDIASSKPFALRRGGLSWPVYGSLSHAYGSRRVNEKVWRGLYISTEPASIVRVPHHGKVIFSDWLKGYGLLMVVEHQQGYMTLYGNNAMLMKKVGDKVTSGEVIAITGYGAEGHGLYFEIRKNGQPVDPIGWLAHR